MDASNITILNVIRDPLPPKRPDVLTLFGKYLVKLGIQSPLVGQCNEPFQGSTWAGGMIYCRGKARGMWASALVPLWDLIGLVQALRENTVDCIQVRDKIASGIVCRIAAAIMRLPFVYWMSFPIVEGYESRARFVKNNKGGFIQLANAFRSIASRLAFYGFVLRYADHIFVQSEAMRDWLIGKGIDPRRLTAIPMCVDTDLYRRESIAPVEDERLIARRVIVYVGVLGKARNSTFLLDLVVALKKIEPTILLVLAGDAASEDERQWIREEIVQRTLESHVLLTGWLTQEQALRYAIRAEIGLSPIPRGELFDVSSPTKLVEYLALGIPGVANDIPDQKLVLEQSGAGICVPMEIAAFSEAILKLLRDEPFRQQCAERGPPFAQTARGYDIMAKKVAQTYRAILEAHA